MATTRRGTAQPFKKGARTLGAALSAAQKGAGATANPQDPDRQLQKNAGGMTKPRSTADQIRLIQRGQTALKLDKALTDRVGGSAPMPRSGGSTGKIGAPDPEGGRRVLADGAPERQRLSRKPTKVADRLAAAPPQKTYVTKGEINKTGNERDGKDYATFTVAGKTGEFHEYVENGKRRVVRVTSGSARGKAAPKKGKRTLGAALSA